MPSDGADSFRNYEVESDSGVKAVSNFAEDSVYQYSRAQTQRAKDIRKQIDQGQEDTGAKDKENTEVTISEDLADGHSANLDASLKLLGVGDLKLLLPSDELEDDEIHIIQTTNVALRDGDHAQQQYQLQLMLLEQQNYRRLLRAKQEPEFRGFQMFDDLASTREYERQIRPQAISKEQLRSIAADKPTSDLRAVRVRNKMPTKSAHKDTTPVTKRRKRDAQSQPQSGQRSHTNAANDEGLNKANVGPLEVILNLRFSSQVFAHCLILGHTSSLGPCV